jgi:hypothetical protein
MLGNESTVTRRIYASDHWEECFTGREHPAVKRAITRLYECYPPECLPQGLCDPMYIMNTIAQELGIGDGQGTFWLKEESTP